MILNEHVQHVVFIGLCVALILLGIVLVRPAHSTFSDLADAGELLQPTHLSGFSALTGDAASCGTYKQ